MGQVAIADERSRLTVGVVGSGFVRFGVGRFRGQRERWTTNGGTEDGGKEKVTADCAKDAKTQQARLATPNQQTLNSREPKRTLDRLAAWDTLSS